MGRSKVEGKGEENRDGNTEVTERRTPRDIRVKRERRSTEAFDRRSPSFAENCEGLPGHPQVQMRNGVRGEGEKENTRLLCAGAGGAGLVVPPADGPREVVKMVVLIALILFLLVLLVSVKPGPSAFVDGGRVL